jgi:hypothetical protein
MAWDFDAKRCTSCGRWGSEIIRYDAYYLAGVLNSVRIEMLGMREDSFKQLDGAYAPRPGHGREDGIAFTEETIELTRRHLLANGVLCIRIDLTFDKQTSRSLAFAPSEAGLQRVKRFARKIAQQKRAILRIVEPERLQ